MRALGLDPGTDTGYALWSVTEQRFLAVLTMPIHRAMANVLRLHEQMPSGLLVMFEDARKNRRRRDHTSAPRHIGYGSIKRDCVIWSDFLNDHKIPNISSAAILGGTKWTSEYFVRRTGWTDRTSEHARDAAARVYQLNEPMFTAMVREWAQRRN